MTAGLPRAWGWGLFWSIDGEGDGPEAIIACETAQMIIWVQYLIFFIVV